MFKSRYDSRAVAINPNNPLAKPKAFDMPPSEYWEQNVKSKEDIVKFYKIYYPELPDAAVEAIARRIQGAVEGKHSIEDSWLRSKKQMTSLEEMRKEIEEQRQIGIQNLQKEANKENIDSVKTSGEGWECVSEDPIVNHLTKEV